MILAGLGEGVGERSLMTSGAFELPRRELVFSA
jgi:hypothetical protein